MQSRVQIVATIGLATKEKSLIKEMIQAGMDVARLNFSWGTYEEHAGYIKNIREASQEVGKNVLIIQDLSGPRIQEKTGHEFNKEAVEVITPKDLADLKFGLEQGVDYIAMSFVGNAGDILKLREEIKKLELVRTVLSKNTKIIAKIERKVALDNIDEIINASDAIIIARGDLGNEIPLGQIPFVEKDIIKKCNDAKKPVIVATQMMMWMVDHDLPTRAEVTDVGFAIISGTDAVMLSEETASGKNPLKVIQMMEEILLEAEKETGRTVFNLL